MENKRDKKDQDRSEISDQTQATQGGGQRRSYTGAQGGGSAGGGMGSANVGSGSRQSGTANIGGGQNVQGGSSNTNKQQGGAFRERETEEE